MSATAVPRRRPSAVRLVVVVLFLLGFLWQVYGAISNLVAWIGFASVLGQSLSAFAWVVLVLGVAIPVTAAVVGLVVGRRSRAGALALVLLIALCVSEALSLSQLAFFLSVIGAL